MGNVALATLTTAGSTGYDPIASGLNDIHTEYRDIMTPRQMWDAYPLTLEQVDVVKQSRQQLRDIMDYQDDRLVLIVGPCSIHDQEMAIEYANELNKLRKEVQETTLIIERVYGEKPRTNLGWKGVVHDSELNGSEDIEKGITLIREILIHNASIGMPSATEFLSTKTPQYYGDLISWGCIGARTTEDPIRRYMASGLSMPIGFKNTTSGDVGVGIDAVLTSREPHAFMGLTPDGKDKPIQTKGNRYTHLVLRGGNGSPNYKEEAVREAQRKLEEKNLASHLLVDCSHGNSNKDHTLQGDRFEEVLKQRVDGNRNIMGIMLESNINEGKQSIPPDLRGFDKNSLEYGVSITDSCIGLEETANLIREAHKALSGN